MKMGVNKKLLATLVRVLNMLSDSKIVIAPSSEPMATPYNTPMPVTQAKMVLREYKNYRRLLARSSWIPLCPIKAKDLPHKVKQALDTLMNKEKRI